MDHPVYMYICIQCVYIYIYNIYIYNANFHLYSRNVCVFDAKINPSYFFQLMRVASRFHGKLHDSPPSPLPLSTTAMCVLRIREQGIGTQGDYRAVYFIKSAGYPPKEGKRRKKERETQKEKKNLRHEMQIRAKPRRQRDQRTATWD